MARGLALALSALAGLTLAGCDLDVGPVDAVRGSGHVRTETRDVYGFDRVEVHGAGTLSITQGATEALTIEAEDNLLPRLQSDVAASTLRLGPRNVSVRPTRPIRYRLTLMRLTSLEVTGATEADGASVEGDQLALRVTGAGKLHLGRVSASDLTVTISGSGEVSAAGQAQRQTVTISGAGDYRAPDLVSQESTVVVSGAGDSTVRATDHLAVTISGAGQVTYAGSPTVEQHVSGAGRLTHTG
jgi:hypothetical protein